MCVRLSSSSTDQCSRSGVPRRGSCSLLLASNTSINTINTISIVVLLFLCVCFSAPALRDGGPVQRLVFGCICLLCPCPSLLVSVRFFLCVVSGDTRKRETREKRNGCCCTVTVLLAPGPWSHGPDPDDWIGQPAAKTRPHVLTSSRHHALPYNSSSTGFTHNTDITFFRVCVDFHTVQTPNDVLHVCSFFLPAVLRFHIIFTVRRRCLTWIRLRAFL